MAREENGPDKLSYADMHDIPRITIEEAKQQIKLSLLSKQRRGTIVLVGESGIGKTEIFEQLAVEHGVRIHPIYTAHYGLMGAGIPTTKGIEDGYFKIAVPDGLPKEGEPTIVLFDEVNKGLRHSIDMFFTMMEAGVLFNYKLPETALVCATMNPETANYVVTQVDSDVAFRRRVKFFYVIPDYKGFLTHAESSAFHASDFEALGEAKPCHPGVLSYFKVKPNNIYDSNARDAKKQFACPATIQTVSLDAYILAKHGYALDSRLALNRYSASIGLAMATELVGHMRDRSVTINPEDILLRYSHVKHAINKMVASEMREKLTELSANVLKIMFSTTPDPVITARNLIQYLGVLPKELLTALLQQMNPLAQECGASGEYLPEIMMELNNHDEWANLVLALDANHKDLDRALQGI